MIKKNLKLSATLFLTFFMFGNLIAQDKYPGYKATSSGIYYKFHTKGEDTNKPEVGDVLTLDLYYTNDKDSVIFDSRINKQIFVLPLAKPLYSGDINEAMSMLSVGDSATFLLDADSFFIKTVGLPESPNFVDKGSKLYFTMTLKDFMTEEEYQQVIAQQRKEEQEQIELLKKEENNYIQKYLEQEGIKDKPRESGLYYVVIEEGTGKQASSGNTVKVHYTGTFLNGDKFDSSRDRGEPIEFVLGQGRVIKGWDEGIALMKEGGKARLIIPSNLAYGDKGVGPIPPVTPLVFDVELLEVK